MIPKDLQIECNSREEAIAVKQRLHEAGERVFSLGRSAPRGHCYIVFTQDCWLSTAFSRPYNKNITAKELGIGLSYANIY